MSQSVSKIKQVPRDRQIDRRGDIHTRAHTHTPYNPNTKTVTNLLHKNTANCYLTWSTNIPRNYQIIIYQSAKYISYNVVNHTVIAFGTM